ncbi:hypothetical protein RO21_11630 [[Actinobacillus] muris]|uniref:Uncharacterized protein n=1 Tax=Muribacter muris TaxID=67855 RepID=A0A0J5P463_9PAST|nr:hypothetical protein [Muribacter muris]KMK50470.1 hypothetical protein RO21_11630 [[Actinobacillus] muris] [Muribacter muris]
MKHYKLVKNVPIASDLSLNFIHRIATSEAQAKDYQLTHYKQTGELLQMGDVPATGYAIVVTKTFGVFFGEALFAVLPTEKEVNKVMKSVSVALPFLTAEVRPLADLSLARYYLGADND